MDKINAENSAKGRISPRTKELQQAKKDKLAGALRDNLRRRKNPSAARAQEDEGSAL